MNHSIKKLRDHTPPSLSQQRDAEGDGTPETQGHSIDAQWGLEAESRLAAYRSGKVKATPLETVLAKYPNWV
ncbi:MAG: addiction module protein [Limnohabitans sp.]